MDTPRDIRYAWRGFTRNPGFTCVSLLSAALGIGAVTAVFSVADAVLLSPLPYPDAGRLAILWNRSPGLGIQRDWYSTAQFFDIRSGARSFDAVGIAIGGNYNLTGIPHPVRAGAVRVSSNILAMFGARAALGRVFDVGDDLPGRAATAVLTHGAWARWFGLDPKVLGRTLVLNGKGYPIVGVLQRGFELPKEVLPTLYGSELPDLFLPLPLDSAAANVRTHEDYNVVARLARGATADTAQTEMNVLTARLRRDHPDLYPPDGGLTFGVVPLFEQVSGEARRPVLIVLAAVGIVLLIACANLSNLLLSRGAARAREIQIRSAIGASRARLVRQLLTESVLITLGGGALGLLLAAWGVAWLRASGPGTVPRMDAVSLDLRAVLFTTVISLAAGAAAGLAPALRLSRTDPVAPQAADRVTGASLWGRGSSLRRWLVVAEAALSVMLLASAGLLVRSFRELARVPAGFDPSGVLTVGITVNGAKYDTRVAVQNAYRQLWARLDHLPGAEATGGISALPLSEMFSWGPVTVEGRALRPGESFINADQRIVAGRYFEALRIPLIEGRYFDERDNSDATRVAIVDEKMARELWPGQSAIGKRIRYGAARDDFPWMTVAGVVGNVKQDALDADSRIAVYMPHQQQPTREMNIVVRSKSRDRLAGAVREVVAGLDPGLPVYDVRTMESRVAASLARRRFATGLLEFAALLALLLAAAGVQGVMACAVNQGTRDIGIRMALGATRTGIAGMVLRGGLAMTAAGCAIGLTGAALLTRFMGSLLFGTHPLDPATFAATPAILLAVAAAAAWQPVRRAWRIEPVEALRME